MSFVESPVETVVKFIPSWKTTPPNRLSAEIVSVFNETNRIPDSFKLLFKEGVIVDYEEKKPVKIDRSGYIGRKEGEFFDTLTFWLEENDRGSALWISPLFPGIYPYNKITLYQIRNTEKKEKFAFGTTLVLETPLKHSVEIAAKLNPLFNENTNPEVLRNKLFSVEDDFDLSNLLEIASIEVNSKKSPSKADIKEVVNLIHSGFDPRFIAERMNQKSLIGQHALVCAALNQTQNLTFGGFMDTHSFIFRFPGGERGKYIKNCGLCGVRIETKITKGYKCPRCGGVYEGC